MDNLVRKEAQMGRLEMNETELALINQHTVRLFGADELFTFKLVLCDNQVDRDFERFSDQALEKLAELFQGKTVIADHSPKSSNQCARIYATTVEDTGGVKRLIAKCYMVRCDGTRDLITEIEAGIKKEVSAGCQIKTIRCSICGADNRKVLCQHIGGQVYGGQTCHFVLEDPTDAYEVSFVAIPAQKQAGVIKAYGGQHQQPTNDPANQQVAQQLRALNGFIFVNRQEEQHDQENA